MAQNQFLEKEIAFTGRFSRNVFGTIALSFAAYRWRVVLLLLTGIFGRFLLLFSTNTLGYWADALCRPPAHCKVPPALFAGFGHWQYVQFLIGLAALGFLFNTIFRVGISRTGSRAVSLLYDEVTLRTSRLPMSFFDTTPVGRIISRFSSDYAAIFRMAGGPIAEFLCLVFDLMLMLVLTSVASPFFVPMVIAVAALNYLSYRRQNVGLRAERRELAKERGPAIAHFSETVQGTSAIRAYGKTPSFTARFIALLDALLLQRVRTAFAIQFFSLTMTTITASILLITGLAGIWLCLHEYVSAGSLGVAFTFIMMTSSTVQQFFEWLANLEEALTGIERLDNYLRRPLEPGTKLPSIAVFALGQPRDTEDSSKIQSTLSDVHTASLEVNQLTLRYRPDLPAVLKDVSFAIAPGEQLAVIGRTGSGKSTLIQALFFLYPFENGTIAINGEQPDVTGLLAGSMSSLRPTGVIRLDTFRRRMALIPQDPTLFRGTLRKNLIFYGGYSDTELMETLSRIGIDAWVSRLQSPTGNPLDAFIDEKGGNLSVGERQLLCMARALLQKSPIVIMDEATSSIDPASEAILVRATQEHMRDKTRIVVAHRLSTIEAADRVLWLDQGRVVMLDRPEAVLPKFRANP